MIEENSDIVKACRRSRILVRVYRALVVLGSALPAELAHYAHTTPSRVAGVLHGDGKKFRRESSLVALGVARPLPKDDDFLYVITPRGLTEWGPVMARLQKTRGPPEG